MKPLVAFTVWSVRLVSLPMALTSQVESRLTAILQKNRSRKMLTRRTQIVTTLTMMGASSLLGAIRPVARAQEPSAVPPSRTSPAPGAAVALPGGDTVQLVRVTLPAMLQAWDPDGTPLPDAAALVTREGRNLINPYGPSLRQIDDPRGWHRYVFDFDLRRLTARPGDVSVEFRPKADVTTLTAPPKRLAPGVWRQRVTGIFTKPPRMVTLRFGLPAGPWRTVAVAGPKLGTVRAVSGAAVVFSRNTINPQALAPAARGQYGYGLRVVNVPSAGQYRLLAVTRDGKAHTLFMNGWPSAGESSPRTIQAQTVDSAGHPLPDIRAIRLQVRDNQWAEFQNVPLVPKGIGGIQ